MCGILGLLADDVDRERLQAASATLQHRGPDDLGVLCDQGFGMAVRRLAIIDIDGGHQPLANEEKTVWVAHNGEIFNAPELREELEQRGHRFRTRSDAEVLAHGWEEWGEELPEKLRGMFAFAVWDRSRRSLFLARDRFGMKPLYVARLGGRFAFASELRALFELLPDLERRPDMHGVGWCLRLGFAPEPLTVIQGVRKLPAAHAMRVTEETNVQHRYWRLERPRRNDLDRAEGRRACYEFLQAATEAVRSWSLADVPIGALLSGGIDSSSVAALMVADARLPLRTVTVGFGDLGADEAPLARATATALGTEHHEVHLGYEAVNQLPRVIDHLEEPRRSTVHLAIWVLFQECRRLGLKVVMSGEGSDEMLGGYSWYHGEHVFEYLTALPAFVRRLAARAPIPVPRSAREIVEAGIKDPVRRYGHWMSSHWGVSPTTLAQVALPDAAEAWSAHFGAEAQDLHPFDQVSLVEQHTRLPDFINHGLDRMSMAHSVEARTPFLDHRLWELAARIPPLQRLNLAGDKLPLRRAMRGLLPRPVRFRGKQGLGVRLAPWWRQERLPDWAETCLSAREIGAAGYFDAAAVAETRAAHRRGADCEGALNAVLSTQLWHRHLVEGTA